MNHQEGSFPGAGGLSLYTQAWLPDGPARAALGIVHGMGDHSGRFPRLTDPLAARGIAVYGFDLRGFGKSPGKKGHIHAWEDYRADLRAFLAYIREQQPNQPVFLLGYSLGAAIVLEFVLRQPDAARGAILIGTPIEPAGVATPAQIRLARVLSRLLPGFTIAMTNDINGVSRDPDVLRALETDPLHHNNVTARWGTESLAATEWIRGQAANIQLPVLFLHGEADPFNLVRGTQRFFEAIPYPDKQMIVYPGSRHELHNDLDHVKVAQDLAAWVLRHT